MMSSVFQRSKIHMKIDVNIHNDVLRRYLDLLVLDLHLLDVYYIAPTSSVPATVCKAFRIYFTHKNTALLIEDLHLLET